MLIDLRTGLVIEEFIDRNRNLPLLLEEVSKNDLHHRVGGLDAQSRIRNAVSEHLKWCGLADHVQVGK